jgi:hypothetical protein
VSVSLLFSLSMQYHVNHSRIQIEEVHQHENNIYSYGTPLMYLSIMCVFKPSIVDRYRSG